MKRKFIIGFAIIFVITLLVYLPSFWHLLRGETYIYFLNTEGHSSFWSLVSNFYNYEKVRVFEPGDTLLFRPLLFTVIGAEKALFGINYLGWHITALMFHMLATFCLFRLLWKMRQSILAVLLSVLFSTLYILVNSVLYEQVAPYMLFTALFLTALYYIDDKPLVSFACMFPASFIHEVGILFAGLMAGYLWLRNDRKWGLVLSSVIPLYLAVYIPQKFINPSPLIAQDANILASLQSLPIGLSSAFSLVEAWFAQVVFPSAFTLKPLPELIYYPAQVVDVKLTALTILLCTINFVVLVVIFAPLLYRFIGRWKRQIWKSQDNLFALLVASMFVVFVLAVSLFRAGSHGTGYLVNHNFGAYIAFACIIVVVYALKKDRVFSPRYYKFLVAVLVLFIISSAPKTFMLNYEVVKQQKNIQPEWLDIKTFKGSPNNPEYYYFTVPQVLEGVR